MKIDMRRISFVTVVIPLLIYFCRITSFAQLNEQGRWRSDLHHEPVEINYESYSQGDFATAVSKLQSIKSESAHSTGEWAGDYSAQSGEVNVIALRWSPQSGFVHLNFYTCLPELRGLDYGTVKTSTGHVTLISQTSRHRGQSVKYLPVKWGERHYLVPENEAAQFYKFVAGYGWRKDEYVFFDFLLKDEDLNKPVAGMPVFPRGYERFVRKPIEAAVTGVLRREIKAEQNFDGSPLYQSHTFVKVGAGSLNGVKRGMTFSVMDSEDSEQVEIVQVRNRTSVGVIVRSLDNDQRETFEDRRTGGVKPHPTVSAGWRLSTRSNLLINNGAM